MNTPQARFQAWMKTYFPEQDTNRVNGVYRNATVRAQFDAWVACEKQMGREQIKFSKQFTESDD